ncbi:hypothetical protein [Rhodococcus sp. UNC23MFCrub1.1]|uniref:hypothetical protein n=1 Tax=Rhodococcus sp. UNC23MFCrub1.1 TaxID=1449068 RepID=UPI0004812B2A|nr:hypothetical protein [Rhodococcus sp. UNC23MFCrub1.1]
MTDDHNYARVFTPELFQMIDPADLRRAFAAITHAGRQDLEAVCTIVTEAGEVGRVPEMTVAAVYAVFGIVTGAEDTEKFSDALQSIIAIASAAEHGVLGDD